MYSTYLIDAALDDPLLAPRGSRGDVGVESLRRCCGHDGHGARPVPVGRQVHVEAALVVAVVAEATVGVPAVLQDEFPILRIPLLVTGWGWWFGSGLG